MNADGIARKMVDQKRGKMLENQNTLVLQDGFSDFQVFARFLDIRSCADRYAYILQKGFGNPLDGSIQLGLGRFEKYCFLANR